MADDILIIDDEADIRNLVRGILEDEGYDAREAGSSDAAYKAVEEKIPSLVVLDIWLQGSQDDGLEILRKLKEVHPDLPFVMISGHGTIETAVAAIKDGAYDFIEKPFKSDRLLMLISRALETAKLRKENAGLKKRTSKIVHQLIGKSSAMQDVQTLIERAAPTNSRVLIKGNAGTGKDVVARLIHKNSLRSDEVFMVVNCATLHPDRLEVELFGAEGDSEHVGIFEQANGGTLLLDEVADMPLETQGKIVRVLQEQQFFRIGGQTPVQTDVRIVATTNRDLEQAIEKGDFREDLFYRLNVVQIDVPLLRDRSEDIPALINAFLDGMLKQSGFAQKTFSDKVMSVMKRYDWPGNVRQLKNVIEWVCIMHGADGGDVFDVEDLPPELGGSMTGANDDHAGGAVMTGAYMDLPLREAREEFERSYLTEQIDRFDGNVSKTAQFIGMERSALHRKMKSLQINEDKDDASSDATPASKTQKSA